MKILKKPDNLVFDTNDPASVKSGSRQYLRTPLHHTHTQTDWEFLTGCFGTDHPILMNFSRSFYYCIETESITV